MGLVCWENFDKGTDLLAESLHRLGVRVLRMGACERELPYSLEARLLESRLPTLEAQVTQLRAELSCAEEDKRKLAAEKAAKEAADAAAGRGGGRARRHRRRGGPLADRLRGGGFAAGEHAGVVAPHRDRRAARTLAATLRPPAPRHAAHAPIERVQYNVQAYLARHGRECVNLANLRDVPDNVLRVPAETLETFPNVLIVPTRGQHEGRLVDS